MRAAASSARSAVSPPRKAASPKKAKAEAAPEVRRGSQTPSRSVVLPYARTRGQEAVDLYNKTGRTAQEWQCLLLYDLLAVNGEELFVHTKFGYAVPRRNGKNEVVAMRELYGLTEGEHILHTAHRTTTSRAAWERLKALLDDAGIEYKASGAIGLEKIRLPSGGRVDFRTRTTKGGLGEGFDLLIIDEAQEYTTDQEASLKYVVSDSKNPQTVFCGTPPTTESSGTVFQNLRDAALAGRSPDTGWAEWSVERQRDPHERDAWYETNPSLGTILTERKILAEIGSDDLDFNIQRLGYWIRYNLKSAISRAEWEELQVRTLPPFKGRLFAGVKYGQDGTNVALSIALKTEDDRIFVEAVDCRPIRVGNGWIIDFLQRADVRAVAVDGANGQQLLAQDMKDAHLKAPLLPTVKEIIAAHAAFEQHLYAKELCHKGQPSLVRSATNCEKRPIGSNGGFGYRSISDDIEVALLESVVLAQWVCQEKSKQIRRQRIRV